MSTTVWIIIAGAVMTYLTRVGGHLVLSRFEHIHPRVEAGLNAVPAAVLTTLVAPEAMQGGPVELTALAVAGVVALRGGLLAMFLTGAVVLIVLRISGFKSRSVLVAEKASMYLPRLNLTAVLPFPNRSYAAPVRTLTSFHLTPCVDRDG